MHGRQGYVVGYVWTEPSGSKGLRTHLTQQDIAYGYRTHRTHRTQGPGGESQDATLLCLTQATFLLMDSMISYHTNRLILLSQYCFIYS